MESYLSARRKEIGLTMKEVAEKVGVSEATISRWESGAIANMKRDKIKKYADALETTTNFIMTGEETTATASISELDGVYLSLAKEAQQNGISPEDIKLAIDTIKRLRGE